MRLDHLLSKETSIRQVLIVTSWSDFWRVFSLFNLEGASLRGEYGGLAQLVEHLLCKQGVSGSSPLISTKTLTSNQFKAQGSGFELERRSSEVSEFSPKAEARDTELATTRANSSAG